MWWAVATVTTVGYGDKFPVTPEDKIVAITLMLLGIAVFGLVSTTLASLFVERDAEEDFDELRADISRLEAKVDRLLDAAEGAADPGV